MTARRTKVFPKVPKTTENVLRRVRQMTLTVDRLISELAW
jgi:hypothetical protein